jgi:polyisoprenoid-binding protein YceI
VALLTMLVSSLVLATAATPNLDSAQSSITATFKQSGVPVDAGFKTFGGRIVFDPANAAAATATLEVLTGSLDIGEEQTNAEVRKPAWLDSAAHPKATFSSASIKSLGTGRLSATGTLTLKGKAQTITIPISVAAAPGGQAFDGAFTLSRRAWGIGDPAWNDVLEDAVIVRFHLLSSGH